MLQNIFLQECVLIHTVHNLPNVTLYVLHILDHIRHFFGHNTESFLLRIHTSPFNG